MPHIVNFVQVGRALSEKQLRNDLVNEQDLHGGRSFALLDRRGCVIECSDGFSAILRSNDLIGLRNNCIVALHPQHRRMADLFLKSALDERCLLEPPLPIRLAGPGHPRGLVLRAVPLPPRGDIFDIFRPAALITLTDLDAPFRARRKDLMALFGLTEREADVAALIGEGRTIERVAQELTISLYTVKQHLKAVFGKMGIERQAELVAMVARIY